MAEKPGQAPASHVEDIPNKPLATDAVLTDGELIAGGLAPVQGWMRTKASKNALRQRKAKAKRESGEDGRAPRKQLNLQAPADESARAALKVVSDRLIDGDLSPSDLDVMGRLDTMRLGIDAQRIIMAGGWRATILRRLLTPQR